MSYDEKERGGKFNRFLLNPEDVQNNNPIKKIVSEIKPKPWLREGGDSTRFILEHVPSETHNSPGSTDPLDRDLFRALAGFRPEGLFEIKDTLDEQRAELIETYATAGFQVHEVVRMPPIQPNPYTKRTLYDIHDESLSLSALAAGADARTAEAATKRLADLVETHGPGNVVSLPASKVHTEAAGMINFSGDAMVFMVRPAEQVPPTE